MSPSFSILEEPHDREPGGLAPTTSPRREPCIGQCHPPPSIAGIAYWGNELSKTNTLTRVKLYFEKNPVRALPGDLRSLIIGVMGDPWSGGVGGLQPRLEAREPPDVTVAGLAPPGRKRRPVPTLESASLIERRGPSGKTVLKSRGIIVHTIFLAMGGILSCVGAVIGAVQAHPQSRYDTTLGPAVFGAIGLALLFLTYRSAKICVAIDEDGLRMHNLYSVPFVPWSDVRGFFTEYHAGSEGSGSWLVFVDRRESRKIRIHALTFASSSGSPGHGRRRAEASVARLEAMVPRGHLPLRRYKDPSRWRLIAQSKGLPLLAIGLLVAAVVRVAQFLIVGK